MTQLNNPMEILKLLDKSNCKECGEATCLAFAATVARGQKRLDQCPHLESNVIERYGGTAKNRAAPTQELDESVEKLKKKIRTIDLASAAERLGAEFSDNKLTLKICGKNFTIDSEGNTFSEIHTHAWLTIPVLNYIIDGGGVPV